MALDSRGGHFIHNVEEQPEQLMDIVKQGGIVVEGVGQSDQLEHHLQQVVFADVSCQLSHEDGLAEG